MAMQLYLLHVDHAQAVSVPLRKRVTSLGSATTADHVVPWLPATWATVHLDATTGTVTLHELGPARTQTLIVGERHRLGPIDVALQAPVAELDVDRLATQLAEVEAPTDALTHVLATLIAGCDADLGAVVMAERGDLSVVVARTATGAPLDDSAALLSDTVVREVLGGSDAILIPEARGTAYAALPSVVALRLAAMVCLPLRLGGKTWGAIFLGARRRALPMPPLRQRELSLIAALAMPFVVQLRRPRPTGHADALIGDAPSMQTLRALIARVAPSDLAICVHGPTGSGKELVARALHQGSPRRTGPFIALNCAAIAPGLLDAELFGYRKGAFTGAHADRTGLIASAQGGVLFLDEVAEMPPAMQAALLRVLETREVRRLGDTVATPVDFRLVTASHRALSDEVAAGRFRADLMYRLAELTIDLPGLAARGDDVVLLGTMFLRQTEAELGLIAHALAADALTAMRRHAWPGNVRELRACMRRAAILTEGVVVRAADLRLPTTYNATSTTAAEPDGLALGDLSRTLDDAREAFVRAYIQAALDRHDGNRDATAKALGIGVRTLYRYLD